MAGWTLNKQEFSPLTSTISLKLYTSWDRVTAFNRSLRKDREEVDSRLRRSRPKLLFLIYALVDKPTTAENAEKRVSMGGKQEEGRQWSTYTLDSGFGGMRAYL